MKLGEMKLRFPMAGGKSDATVLMDASIATETNGAKKSPRPRAAVGAAW